MLLLREKLLCLKCKIDEERKEDRKARKRRGSVKLMRLIVQRSGQRSVKWDETDAHQAAFKIKINVKLIKSSCVFL